MVCQNISDEDLVSIILKPERFHRKHVLLCVVMTVYVDGLVL